MILCDTGFWLALANSKDRYYQRAKKVAESLKEDPITTWPVITEACHLLTNRLNPKASILFIKNLRQQNIEIQQLTENDLIRIQQLMKKYADLPMDLADASLVILAEQQGHGRILSTDVRDFNSYRWKNHKPFENLLLHEHS